MDGLGIEERGKREALYNSRTAGHPAPLGRRGGIDVTGLPLAWE